MHVLVKDQRLEQAVQLGQIILQKTARLRMIPLCQMPLLSCIPLLNLARDSEKTSPEAISPEIHEILLYGSVARSARDPGDIDLLIIDNGHFSPVFVQRILEAKDRSFVMSKDSPLNFDLLCGWLGIQDDPTIEGILESTFVDLHIFPLMLLTSKKFRDKIAKKMKDPHFLRNLFRNTLRYEHGQFVAVDIDDLACKYDCDLDDLR